MTKKTKLKKSTVNKKKRLDEFGKTKFKNISETKKIKKLPRNQMLKTEFENN